MYKKLTKKTLSILKSWHRQGYAWLTKDKMHSRVFLHIKKPTKLSQSWYSYNSMMWVRKSDETKEIIDLCSWDVPVEIAKVLKENGVEVEK
mgnify:CR=1 FL=1|jgi:hypothetical protein